MILNGTKYTYETNAQVDINSLTSTAGNGLGGMIVKTNAGWFQPQAIRSFLSGDLMDKESWLKQELQKF
jgi:hypothetical protein